MSQKVTLLMVLIVMISVICLFPASVRGETPPVGEGCVRLHYLRADFTYSGWGLHIWGDGYTGPAVDWASPLAATGMDGYGPYWDLPFGDGELNFIVHRGDAKQYGSDRSFPGPAVGKEVWVIQDDANYYENINDALAALGVAADPEIAVGQVRIYYLRSDKSYDGWGLHAWTASGDLPGVSWGTPLPITGYDKYGYAFWDVPANIAGYIIHKGDQKDTPADRRLDPTNNENFVVSGDPANYTQRLTAMQKLDNRIVKAIFLEKTGIELVTLEALDSTMDIKIFTGDTEVRVSSIDASSAPRYYITLAKEIDFNKSYRVVAGQMSAELTVAAELIDKLFAYGGKLGALYTPTATTFKLWAPLASDVKLLFYKSNSDTTPASIIGMIKGEQGVWSCTVAGNLDGQLYQYQVTHGQTSKLVLDPYAKSMAAFNSDGPDQVGKGVVIDLRRTDPVGWKRDRYVKLKKQEDAIIYEVHVRDFTIADSSIPQKKRGTYEGFIEKIPYLKKLGITHVQLLPVQNWYYGNEMNRSYESGMATDHSNYNWGYDPHNYHTPEGWYASDPNDPYARVRELKLLISKLHEAGIGVVLDVVYNHTAVTSIFEDIVPGYYYRRNDDGTFTSGSGCGNDTASERAMFRKLMIDSAAYWVREYHIDGFRFDLMGLHDLTTMNLLAATCRAINPHLELHGEGWNLGTLPLHERYCKGGGSEDDYHRALLEVSHGISAFSDGMRDGLIQENYQTPTKGGFVQHDQSYDRDHEALVRRGIVGNIVGYTTTLPINENKYDCFCDDPEESVNYTTCHDGLTINDKLKLTLPSVSREEFIKRYKLQFAIVMTSQGKAFFQAGEELFRSKPATDPAANQAYISNGYCHNSHDASDDINKIDWAKFQARDPETIDLFNFYAGMIALRKAHPAFRMGTTEMIQKKLTFIDEGIDGLIAYRIRNADGKGKGRWNDIIVIFNATSALQRIAIPGVDLRDWKVVVDGDQVNLNGIDSPVITLEKEGITVPGIAAVVLHGPVRKGRSHHASVL